MIEELINEAIETIVETLKIPKDWVRVVLYEVPKENWLLGIITAA